MNYTRKICPVCKKEFFVLKKVEEKAIYCTLECLSEAHDQMKGNEISSLLPA